MDSRTLAQPLTGAPSTQSSRKVFVLVSLFFSGLGCIGLYQQFGGNQQPQAMAMPATNMMAYQMMQPLKAQAKHAEARAIKAAAAGINAQSLSRHAAAGKSWAFASAIGWAARDGARVGCRGSLACAKAVGLFFGTQTGKTEEAAEFIAGATGLEAQDIGDVSAGDLAGFDGIIAGVPTWHTGADEQRSGTVWDDYLEEIRGLDMCGKPVAVFGLGDQAGYGDNFCDGIEEIHATFAAAGAKMVGYTDASGYEMYTESKSVKDGKFLGLPLDGDNEPDMTEARVKAWVEQLKSEGMPV
jgi:flavodoxin I